MDFAALESIDGIRLSFNIFPNNKQEANKCILPLGALYSPLKNSINNNSNNNNNTSFVQRVNYDPLRCKNVNCGAILNPYCQVDYPGKMWMCPMCLTRNTFPQHYAGES